MSIEDALFRGADCRIFDLNKEGVAQGRHDILEPERQHLPDLVNMEEYEDWTKEAVQYSTESAKKKRKRKLVGELIEVDDIQKEVITIDGRAKKCRHAMVIAPAGMGKTTLLRRIAQGGRLGKYKSLEKKLILMVDLRIFSSGKEILPSLALLRSIFRDIGGKILEEMYQWIKENSEKVVFVIDSLDTLPFDLENERQRIGYHEKATIEVILHNLLAGDLFPKSEIISSSREYKVRNLHHSVRPDRCVLLDGIKEESVKDLIDGFLGDSKGAEVKNHINSECPSIWPLLSTPVFLIFYIIGLEQGGFKPMTISGILIKFLLSLVVSPHAHATNIISVLNKLMPLSFEGIRNGHVLFTPEDLKRFDLESDEVSDIGILLPQSRQTFFSSKLMQNDRFFLYFNHQTIQECISALHVLSIDLEHFKTFIERDFHEPRFGVVRRLLCGVLLNEDVLNAAQKLGKFSHIQQKKTILLDSYRTALKREQAREWDEESRQSLLELFLDLNESKDGTAELIRTSVHKISLRRVPLRPNEVQAVASVMKQCDHLEELNLRICKLNEKKMEILTRTVLQSNVKVDKLDISENKLGEMGSLQAAKLASHCQVKSLRARNCLESDGLKAFLDGAGGLKLTVLDVGENRNIGSEGMLHLGKLVDSSAPDDLDLRMCNLKSQHLEKFAEGASKAKLKKLDVTYNDELGPEGMHVLGKLTGNCEVEDLIAEVCNLQPKHMQNLTEGIGNSNLKKLDVSWNQSIGSEGMFHLGRLVGNCKLENLETRMCNLKCEHLERFSDGAGNAKLGKLDVSDNRELGTDGMHLLGKLIQDHEVKDLDAAKCCSKPGQVQSFIDGLGDAKMYNLNLSNNWEPLYTRSLLDLLPHVEKELQLRYWFISANQQKELQDKLNEIGSLSLTIEIGTPQNPVQLKAELCASQDSAIYCELDEKIKANLTRPISTAKAIGENGGSLQLHLCKLRLPKYAFEKRTTVSLTLRLEDDDVPEGHFPLSPSLKCSSSNVRFKGMATITLTTYYNVDGEHVVILCKKDSQDEWEEVEIRMSLQGKSATFQVSHFTKFRIFAKLRSRNWKILLENSFYFDQKTMSICGLTCVNDETAKKYCISELEGQGYSRMALPDDICLKRNERMVYSIKFLHQAEGVIDPDTEFICTAAMFKHSKKETVYFKVKPTTQNAIMYIRYNLTRPNEKPRKSDLPLRFKENVLAHVATDATGSVSRVEMVGSSESEYSSNHSDRDTIYYIDPNRRKGKALIINNDFNKTREGSDVDMNHMKSLWHLLGFDVVDKTNRTGEQLLNSCMQFASDTTDVSVVVVVIMSHGGRGNDEKDFVVGEDNSGVLVEDIISIFTSNNSPHLHGIPKLFLFQACRGDAQYYAIRRFRVEAQACDQHQVNTRAFRVEAQACDQHQVNTRFRVETPDCDQRHANTQGFRVEVQDDDRHQVDTRGFGGVHSPPHKSDMLIAFSTQPGYTSIRNTSEGSWFINAVTTVFMEQAHNTNVLQMFTRVNGDVARRISANGWKQICSEDNSLTKDLFLYPGWPAQ